MAACLQMQTVRPKRTYSNGKPKIQHCISGATPFLLALSLLYCPFYAMTKWPEHALLL